MRSSQQETMAYTKSRQTQHTVKPQQETVDTQSLLPPQSYPLTQTISRISNTPSASTHAAMLNRSPAAGQSSNRQLVLQLQRQYGNRYVNQVVQMARRGEAEAADESISASGVHQENKTGLPDNLKAGIETLSGISMDDVEVHYNSSKPAQLQALAYTQGTDIYVRSGQEKYIAHEAWHVAQQKQGRVKPTLEAKGVRINDDQKLEKEADVMGERSLKAEDNHGSTVEDKFCTGEHSIENHSTLAIIQRMVRHGDPNYDASNDTNIANKEETFLRVNEYVEFDWRKNWKITITNMLSSQNRLRSFYELQAPQATQRSAGSLKYREEVVFYTDNFQSNVNINGTNLQINPRKIWIFNRDRDSVNSPGSRLQVTYEQISLNALVPY